MSRRMLIVGLAVSCMTMVGCAPEDGQEEFSFAAPVAFSVPSGDYGSDQIVELSSVTPESIIYYTTDGSDPTIASEHVYDEPIVIAGHGTNVEIRAIAVEAGRDASEPASASYSVWYYDRAAAPYLSPAPGTYSQNLTIAIATKTPDAEIYYTIDGSEPSLTSRRFESAIMLETDGESVDIRAVAYRDGMRLSETSGGIISVDYEAIDPPSLTPLPGEYNEDQTIELATLEGARVHYTLDGSAPSVESPLYTNPIELRGHGSEVSLRAVAFANSMKVSTVAEGDYRIEYLPTDSPAAYPAAGIYNGGQMITLLAPDPQSQIYYTVNGTTPTLQSARYVQPFFIPAPGDFKVRAIAVSNGRIASSITRSRYELTYNVVADVNASPPAGTYQGTQTVILSSATPGAEIYYSFGEGQSEGEAARFLYTEPLQLTESATITVQAWKNEWIASSVTTETFVITEAPNVEQLIDP